MASDQLSLVKELMNRRSQLTPEQGAIVDELAKRFMRTGELRPDVPGAPTPPGLQGPPAQPLGAGPKGAMAHGMDVQPGWGVLDIPPVAGAREAVEGVRNIAGGQVTKGALETLRGGMGAASVLLPAAVIQAPLRTAVGMGAGMLVGGGTEAGMRALGAAPETAALTGDVAGLVAGGKAATANRLAGDIGTLSERLLPSIVPKNPNMAMVKALKPKSTNLEFPLAMDRALPEVKASETELGRPIQGVDDMIEAVKLAKARVWKQREQFAGPQREMGAQVDLTPVADAMARTIPAKLKLEDPQAAARLVETANKYRGKFNIQDAEEFLRTTNAEMDSYYNKYPTARRSAASANPETAALDAQAKALRTAIYGTLDAPGQGAGPRELGRRYGALLNLEEELYRRRNVAQRQQPESLSMQVGRWSGAGNVVSGLFKGLTGNVAGAAVDIGKGIAERKAAEWIRDQQTTDAIIRTTMGRYVGRPSPVSGPPPFKPAGLLGPGPIVTPAPEDTSFVRGVPGMYPTGPNPARALPPPSDVITPPPADTSYVRGVPAQYAERILRSIAPGLNPAK